MPLPDAPPVETSRIYQQFKGLNALGNVTGAISSDLMDNVTSWFSISNHVSSWANC